MEKFYLCNPDNEKSCGACCGMYNFKDHSEEHIFAILRERKKDFIKFGNDLASFRGYRENLERELILSPFIYTCPFLTFLDSDEKKVGCIIHPLVTGKELRDVAFYGSEVCMEHRCTAYIYYTEVEIKAITSFTHDSYLYGLVLHDIDFVRSFFRLIEDDISRKIKISDLENQDAAKYWEEYFDLKRSWPFLNKNSKILDKYEFIDKTFKIRELNTFGLLEKKSNLYKILRALESNFYDKMSVKKGIDIILNLKNNIVDILSEQQ